MKHLKYLSYVLKHKWFVLQAGLRLKRDYDAHISTWQLLIHDWTKFLPREWGPYAEYFYGQSRWYIPYCEAWLAHQRNKHHWQAWVLLWDEGSATPLQMPARFEWEMLADWMGAGMAIKGHGLDKAFVETAIWYNENREKMQLHPSTRLFVESFLGLDPYRVATGEGYYDHD